MAYVDRPRLRDANLSFIQTAMRTPLLSRDEELRLIKNWLQKRDEKSLHKLVGAHHRLVVSLAHKFRHYGLPVADLMQEGAIGLMTAAHKFDTAHDVRFATYATWWIRSAIQDYILRNWSIVRTGTTSAQKSLFFNLRRLRARIEGAKGTSSNTYQEIADTLGVRVHDVTEMATRMNGGDQSLNAPLGYDSEDDFQSQLVDTRDTPEEYVSTAQEKTMHNKWVADALRALPEREQIIVTARHLSDKTATLEELGVKLGVSKERVRQLEARAMGHLRTHLMPYMSA